MTIAVDHDVRRRWSGDRGWPVRGRPDCEVYREDCFWMKSPQAKSVRLLQEKYQENLEIMLRNLLKDETLSDITIHCKDGAVRAHRLVLAASSPYFKKVFQEHPEHQVAFLVHGVTVKQIKSLIELMYRGSTQIPSDMTNKLCDIAEEFGMKGIVDEDEKSLLSSSGRDTRYKGQKRVTVDFENDSSDTQAAAAVSLKLTKIDSERRISVSSDKSVKKSPENLVSNPWSTSAPTLESLGLIPTPVKQEPRSPTTPSTATAPLLSTPMSAEARRRNNWAMKQRKYKCSLCPASFKRASHLSRHQLVHTGERPYACDQCDKAFSRHDKLKHHVRKAHSLEYVGNLAESSTESELYTIGNVKIDTSLSDEMSEEPSRLTREDLLARMPVKVQPAPAVEPDADAPPEASHPEAATSDTTGAETSSVGNAGASGPPKKGRGRPRKYPPVPRPLIKRPRGRPRLNQTVPPIRPGLKRSQPERRSDNYDITNMPFGDIEYLTKSIHMERSSDNFDEPSNSVEPNFMEPLVEIELEQSSSKKPTDEEDTTLRHNTAGSFLQNIGLLETSAVAKMEIGECTISVSNGPGFS